MFRKGDEPIPGYRLEKFLGKGQFGEVWKTTAPGGTSAALKFIDLGGKQGIKEFRGVQRVKEIRHTNLMPITALWMLDGEGNILSDRVLDTYDPERHAAKATMQVEDAETVRPEWLVVGMLLGRKNLEDRLKECVAEGMVGIPADELLRYMEEAAKGIDYLNRLQHDFGEGCVAIQHCDIKPANIMLIGDAATVCDFGLARVLSNTAAVTATGMVGSPAYMAPECIGRKPGPASDQYSLAVSYAELRSGQLPFKEISYLKVLEANRNANLDFSRLTPPEQHVLRKATALKPEDRYATTLEMIRALRQAIDGTAPRAVLPLWVWGATAVAILTLFPTIAWISSGTMWRRSHGDVRVVTVSLSPPDAQVTLDGQPRPVESGRFDLSLRPGDRIALEATHPDGYAPLRRQFTWEQAETDSIDLKLDRNANWHADRAREWVAEGRIEDAVTAYKAALLLDPTLESPKPRVLREHTQSVREIVSLPGRAGWASVGDDRTVRLWTPADDGFSAAMLPGLPDDQLTECLAVSPDGRWLVAGGQNDQVVAWDLAGGPAPQAPVVLAGHEEDVTAVEFGAEGRWIASSSFDQTIRLWPVHDRGPEDQAIVLRGHEAEVMDLVASADGRWLVSLASDNQLRRWELPSTRDGDPPMGLALPAVESRVRTLAISADSAWIVVGREDGVVAALALAEPTMWFAGAAGTDAIESLAISPSSARVVVGDSSGDVRQYAFAAGQLTEPKRVYQHVGPVVALAFSSDASFGVSGSWDKAVAYWRTDDARTLAPLVLPSEQGPVHDVSITADGRWIIAGCSDGSILIWDARLCEVIQRAVERKEPSVPAIEA